MMLFSKAELLNEKDDNLPFLAHPKKRLFFLFVFKSYIECICIYETHGVLGYMKHMETIAHSSTSAFCDHVFAVELTTNTLLIFQFFLSSEGS